jgi:hypothetical protein
MTDDAFTADQLLARALAAAGGAAWGRVRTLHVEGRLRAGGMAGPYEQWIDLERGRHALAFTLGPATMAGGYDGARAWQRSANGEVMAQDSEAALRTAATDAWINARGWWFADRHPATIDALGRREADGLAFDVLQCVPAGGGRVELWFDASSHLLARIATEVLGKPSLKRLDDHREVHGLRLPFRTTSGSGDPRFDRVVEVDAVTIDVELPSSIFEPGVQQVDDLVFVDGGRRARLPVDIASHHVFVAVELDGHPLRFILDTGGVNLVTTEAAARLGLCSEGELEGRGPGERSVTVGFTRVERLAIGGQVVLERQLLRVLPMPGFDEVEGVPFDGVLGVELFRRLVVRIDYAGAALELIDPAVFEAPTEAHSLPLTFFGHFPGVDGDLDGAKGQFWLDTGNRGGLFVAGPFARAHGLAARHPASGVMTIGWGVGGGVEGRLARGGRLALGTIAIDGPVLRLPSEGGGVMAMPDVAGNVGGEILSRFDVTFDYGRQRVLLVPNHAHGKPFAADRAGLWVNRRGTEVVVKAVVADGPAAVAGLQIGDVVSDVDGEPAAGVTLDELRRRLREWPAGKVVALRVTRNGVTFEAALQLRDLIPAA